MHWMLEDDFDDDEIEYCEYCNRLAYCLYDDGEEGAYMCNECYEKHGYNEDE